MVSAPRPERILAARDLLGETLQNIAASAGISQSYLSEIASGARPFTSEQAERIAGATGLPVEFFEVESPSVGTTLQFRRLKSTKVKTTKKAVQYFREASRIVQGAALLGGLQTKSLPYVNEPTSGVLDGEAIEGVALKTRALMGLDAVSPIPNVMRAIERLGIVVVPVLLDPTGDVNVVDQGHFGISHGDEHGVPLLGYFPGASPDRDRFTLSHELGHVLLHSRRSSDDAELEAHHFAGALLLPERAARQELHSQITLNQLAHVKARFGVSIQALIMRAAALDIIDAKRHRSLFVQLSARGWRQHEPVEVVAEYPVLMGRLLEIAIPDGAHVREVEATTALPRAYIAAMAPSPPRRGTSTGKVVRFPA
ncbi:Zn-dependent peptidase ImmA, M78 family [Raineyella antarctica]|uniref:Zn-dependent peptidase ImmA, M78 family n=1 Tax=Raineyella antarctica TaxID=1577474 RepID=A0A1G6ITJ5_9ACTN|nr:XRE family transcriptional regulator [Raineyella antarctica]SDC09819.1 Zn-dependent peptidase ImmA, M78 family [Raineyella antarctica]